MKTRLLSLLCYVTIFLYVIFFLYGTLYLIVYLNYYVFHYGYGGEVLDHDTIYEAILPLIMSVPYLAYAAYCKLTMRNKLKISIITICSKFSFIYAIFNFLLMIPMLYYNKGLGIMFMLISIAHTAIYQSTKPNIK